MSNVNINPLDLSISSLLDASPRKVGLIVKEGISRIVNRSNDTDTKIDALTEQVRLLTVLLANKQ
jgi:hypothetical protein